MGGEEKEKKKEKKRKGKEQKVDVIFTPTGFHFTTSLHVNGKRGRTRGKGEKGNR